MYARLGELVSRHWLAAILAWMLILVALRLTSPNWADVTRDGDLAFLPADRPSVQGEKLAARSLPREPLEESDRDHLRAEKTVSRSTRRICRPRIGSVLAFRIIWR